MRYGVMAEPGRSRARLLSAHSIHQRPMSSRHFTRSPIVSGSRFNLLRGHQD